MEQKTYKIKRFLIVSAVLFFVFIIFLLFTDFTVNANGETINEIIEEQLESLNLSDLEDFYQKIEEKPADNGFFDIIKKIVNGEINTDFSSIFSYLFGIFFSNVKNVLPPLFTVLAIAILCGIFNGIKSNFISQGIGDVLFFVFYSAIILILFSSVKDIYDLTENTIKNIANLSQIMSPIIVVLMLAGGGNASIGVYKPTLAFLSFGMEYIILDLILPTIAISMIFNVLSNLSSNIKFKNFAGFFSGFAKWIIGIFISVYSIFVTIQGLTAGSFDGISLKAAKYAISNSVPIIGGFLGGGFDVVVAGSVLIKNAVGFGIVIALFYTILSPIIYIATFSLALKLISALTEPVSDPRICDLCASASKGFSFLAVIIILAGFIFFITVLLMILSLAAV